MEKSKSVETKALKKNNEAGTGYPSPAQLATPTDLKPDEVRNVVNAVNPLIADAFALYTKTKKNERESSRERG